MKIAEWIWRCKDAMPDEHAEFLHRVELEKTTGERCVIKLSCDSDYAFYLNGELVDFGQYADFPHYKVYDEIDITERLTCGVNLLAFEVWYFGAHTSTYYKGDAGLWFELSVGDSVVCGSGEDTLCRLSPTYINHRCKFITTQLGYSYSYDSRFEDEWKAGLADGFCRSALVPREAPRIKRPIKKLVSQPAVTAMLIKREGNRYLFDVGREEVGIFRLAFHSEREGRVKIAYGEHIDDGWVRALIGPRRDFSLEYFARIGKNDFLGYKRRLGLRYVELEFEGEAKDIILEIIPRAYPISRKERNIPDARLREIYEVGVRTLELCMHEHYEDCPWREQSLYALDSRNQMLSGYYAFAEYDFPRASLKLFAEDRRHDGLLSICAPAGHYLAIPSFSLHWYTEVREYLDYSGDVDFIREIYPKLTSVIGVFTDRLADRSLVERFTTEEHWNFYEWAEELEGALGSKQDAREDLILNTMLVIALEHFAYLSERIGRKTDALRLAERVRRGINSAFYDEGERAYRLYSDEPIFTELGNALAILSGAATGEAARSICERLLGENGWIRATLSMRSFVYDALLKTDEGYVGDVFESIKEIWGKMLDKGATTFWETEEGSDAFSGAGSLCHGWSATPVYYIGRYLK